MKISVIGGGAAGFFAAVTAKATYPDADVTIFERTNKVLSKVRISGGGRCNVTHFCFDPKELVKNYPRGHKELLGPFHRFGPRETFEWFESRGVKLVSEKDGRVFPSSNVSAEIINCLLDEAKRLGVKIVLQSRIEELEGDRVILATGSHKSGYAWAKEAGHTIQEPVPSLFTFNVPNFELVNLSGVSVPEATVSIVGTKLVQTGPLLITHWGFSGPAVLKLSAWGARLLHERNYEVEVEIDWGEWVPKRLRDRPRVERFLVKGKTTHKAEFVTCGGVTLSEVNFKTMESKCRPGLYFAGEILDIDGVTGGFNFQNAWTTGYIAGSA